MTEYTNQGISITTHTETCCEFPVTSNIMHLYTGEEQIDSCINCYETKESKSDKHAWDLHESDRLGEGPGLSTDTDESPNASDWVSSETITKEQTWTAKMTEIWDADNPFKLIQLAVEFIDRDDPWLIRKEFTNPVTQLIDGGTHDELWELDDMRQRSRETQCPWCNILTPKVFNDCQSCDRTLESNVR